MGDPIIDTLLEKIAQNGWTFVGVGADRHSGDPQFAYTCGLDQYGHPELAINGALPIPAMQEILNGLAKEIRDGATLKAGDKLEGRLKGGYVLGVIEISPQCSAEYLRMAANVRNPRPAYVPALQVVWPDQDRHLPWEPEYLLPPEAQVLWGRP